MADTLLSCDALTLRVDNRTLIESLSFSVKRGEIVGILGKSGSGKTSLLKAISGLMTPFSGSIRILGVPPSPAILSHIAFLPTASHLPSDMTATELARLFSRMFDDFDAERATSLLRELRVNTEKKFRALSRGTQDKIRLILTMSRRVSLYLLDEPIGKGDDVAKDYMLDLIRANKSENASVLLATERIADAEALLDSFILLSEGKLEKTGDVSRIKEETALSLDEYLKGETSC